MGTKSYISLLLAIIIACSSLTYANTDQANSKPDYIVQAESKIAESLASGPCNVCPFLTHLRKQFYVLTDDQLLEIGNLGRHQLSFAEVRLTHTLIRYFRGKGNDDYKNMLCKDIITRYGPIYSELNASERYNYNSILINYNRQLEGIRNYITLLDDLSDDKSNELYGLSANQLNWAYNNLGEFESAIQYGKIAVKYRGDQMTYSNLIFALSQTEHNEDYEFYLIQANRQFNDQYLSSLVQFYIKSKQDQKIYALIDDYASKANADEHLANVWTIVKFTDNSALKQYLLETILRGSKPEQRYYYALYRVYMLEQKLDRAKQLIVDYGNQYGNEQKYLLLYQYATDYLTQADGEKVLHQLAYLNTKISDVSYQKLLNHTQHVPDHYQIITDLYDRDYGKQRRMELEIKLFLYDKDSFDNELNWSLVDKAKQVLQGNDKYTHANYLLGRDRFKDHRYRDAYWYLVKVLQENRQYQSNIHVYIVFSLDELSDAKAMLAHVDSYQDVMAGWLQHYAYALAYRHQANDERVIAHCIELYRESGIADLDKFFDQFSEFSPYRDAIKRQLNIRVNKE